MQPFELAYIAGLVDGEAHVCISREPAGIKGRRSPAYKIRFEIGMTDREPLDYINSLLPKAKLVKQYSKGRRLPYYRFRLSTQEAFQLLKDILPYSQGKRDEILICIELETLRRQYSPSIIHTGKPKFQQLPDEFIAKAEILYWKLRSLHLNKKPRFIKAAEKLI